MSRPTSLLMAAAVAALVVGCAHCDTCDDFPAPCTDCGYSSPAPGMEAPIITDSTLAPIGYPAGVTPGAPITSGSPIINSAPSPPAIPGSAPATGTGTGVANPSNAPAAGDLPPIPPLPDSRPPF